LLERRESTVREVTLTERAVTELMAGIETAETVGQVTPELLTSGEWEDVEFAEYNVEADAEQVEGRQGPHPAPDRRARQRHPRRDGVPGEMDGPHVDADFWINDCLFMPQDHPARTHWDRFALEQPTHIDDLPRTSSSASSALTGRASARTARAITRRGTGLRPGACASGTHTTSLSTRYLSGEEVGDLEPPQRYFSVEKVYRNDTLDRRTYSSSSRSKAG